MATLLSFAIHAQTLAILAHMRLPQGMGPVMNAGGDLRLASSTIRLYMNGVLVKGSEVGSQTGSETSLIVSTERKTIVRIATGYCHMQ